MRFVPIRVISFVSFFLSVASLQAQTQAEINAQARADFAKADLDLNKTYQAVLAKLPTAEKQKLKEAQRAWVKSRDAEAASAAKEAEGGSIAPTIRYGRMTDLTRKRIAELKAMIDKGTASAAQTDAIQSEDKERPSVSEAETPPPPAANSISPDKKWEYVGGEEPQLVSADTKEVAVEFSCSLGGSDVAAPVWAPDSKRFALRCSGGKGSETSIYQQRDNGWEALEEPLGNGDEIFERAGNIVEAKAKKKGLRKGTFLHMNRWTVEPQRWIDSNTLVVYAAIIETVHRNDGEYVGPGYGTDLLVTLKFDDAGKWKIIKTHEMSKKEVEATEKNQ
jgi:uncharacterized protein YecT (DUF1311 family)